MATGWVEKRQNERVLATLKATYQRLSPLKAQEMQDHPDYMSTPSGPGDEGGFFHAQTKDVSAGGMALVAQDPIKPGERILVKIELPQLPKPITCLAEVRWLKSFEEMKRIIYRAGLKFLSIHKDDVARLNEYVRTKSGA
jgi:c-di-GMP-binding flagellar brake protein YcgR